MYIDIDIYVSLLLQRKQTYLDLRSAWGITSASAALPAPSGYSPAIGTGNDRSCGIPWNTGDLQVLILSLWVWQCMQTQHLEEIKSKHWGNNLWTERNEIRAQPWCDCVVAVWVFLSPRIYVKRLLNSCRETNPQHNCHSNTTSQRVHSSGRLCLRIYSSCQVWVWHSLSSTSNSLKMPVPTCTVWYKLLPFLSTMH